jgi:hypothetical protein
VEEDGFEPSVPQHIRSRFRPASPVSHDGSPVSRDGNESSKHLLQGGQLHRPRHRRCLGAKNAAHLRQSADEDRKVRCDLPRCGGGAGGDGGDQVDIDPVIRGLLACLPKSGDVWPEAERKLWLELLAGSFKLIYKDAPPSDGQHEAER